MRCKLIEGTKENLKATVQSLGVRGKMDLKPVITVVQDVIDNIRENGDAALLGYTEKFDGVKLTSDQLRVSEKEIEEGIAQVDPELLTVMKKAAANIRRFHEEQKEHGFMMDAGKGAKIGVRVRPISIAGVYVPGGTAPLPSTVLMDVIPASVGATEIYRMGGAQAIAAMAYGTESVPRVDKICGPGNIYVNTAKRLVFGQVDIDMFAGPSEILIIADKTANPDFVAADMLSQAEHDKMASAIVLTDSRELAEKVLELADKRSEMAERKEILAKSMEDYCAIIVCDSLETAINFSEEIAPEHLELCVENPELVANKINNCGAMFLGNYSPEPLGDYFAGPNHTLPTSGTARFFSPLNTGDFYKKMSVINYNEAMLKDVYKDVAAFADSEGLGCHAAAIRARFED